MTDIDETTQHENGAGADEIDQSTILEQIRQRRRNLLENRTTYIDIPGYEEIGLVAQYHLLDGKQMDHIVERVRKQFKGRVERGLTMSIDTMIAACDGLFLDQGNGIFQPFDPSNSGSALVYNSELAQFVGIDATTARGVVRGLFGENDSAIAAHSMKLQRWFQDTTRNANEEFLGEL